MPPECEALKDEICTLLNEKCFRLNLDKQCEFIKHYTLLKDSNCPPITAKVKENIFPKFLERWKEFAQTPSKIGKKDMTGIPVEQSIRDFIIEEMKPFNVNIHDKGKKYSIWEDNNIIADVLIQKEKYPDTIISVKSWIGSSQIRETFAYGYFSKTWHGQKNIRLYMVTLIPFQTPENKKDKRPDIEKMKELCKPYIDGIYSLSEEPFLDDLIPILHDLYR